LRRNKDDTPKLLGSSTSAASSVLSRLDDDDKRVKGSDELERLEHEPRRNVYDDERRKKNECGCEWKRHGCDE